MTDSLSDFKIDNFFSARDILSSLKERSSPSYVALTLSGTHDAVEGTLLDVKGDTALLRSGQSLRFVRLENVAAIRVNS